MVTSFGSCSSFCWTLATNVALTVENRPAWIPLGSVSSDGDESGATHGDEGGVQVPIVLVCITPVQVAQLLAVHIEEVDA